jgi:hypothetical protein
VDESTPNAEILMESMVAARDLEPIVALRWGGEEGKLTPDECREHARRLFETAEAAEHDSALCRFLREQLHLDGPATFAMLRDLRVHRGTRRLP